MTPAGVFTTLVQFTGDGASNKGRNPVAPLVQGEDGNFYGTTPNGGANDLGTVFKMTPEGQLTTLVEFTGNDGANKGRGPAGPLLWGGDGFFYGTTESGGTNGSGTVFKMTPEGQLTTLWEFLVPGSVGNEGTGGANPSGPLVRGGDGFLYGTTRKGPGRYIDPGFELPGSAIDQNYGTVFKMSPNGIVSTVMDFITPSEGGMLAGNLMADAEGNIYGTAAGTEDGGTIFRIIVRGTPSVVLKRFAVQGTTGATVEAQVNARGSSTAVTLEYGTDGITFPNVVSLASGLSGFQTKSVGTSFTGLTLGTTYFYRLRASSSAGTTLSPVTSFTTLAEPVVAASPASEVAAGSARFNGTVNARNFDSTVVFEWGTDGNSFPNTAPAVPGVVTGNTPVLVSAAVAGLPEGGTVFFRLRATNAAGTAISGARSFSTVSVTTAALGDADVGVTEAVFKATINTFGQTAAVKFKYWADSAPLAVLETATQSVTTVNGPTEVSARVTELLENVSYSYRVSVELAGTETDGGAVAFTMDTNQPPVAEADVVFYAGQVLIEALENDSDANNVAPTPANAGLTLAPDLETPPRVNADGLGAKVTPDGRFISYNPGSSKLPSDSLVYRVRDAQGLSATAAVTLINFRVRQGQYSAPERPDAAEPLAVRGDSIAFSVGETGAGTGKLNWSGENYPFSGGFDNRGEFTRTFAKRGEAGATVTLSVRMSRSPMEPETERTLIGTVVERAGTSETASVEFKAKLNRGVARPGKFTVFMDPPAAEDDPTLGGGPLEGDGFLVLTVTTRLDRRATYTGRLPDGEPIAGAAPASGLAYLFDTTKLYRRRPAAGGRLVGVANILQDPVRPAASALSGELDWTKNAATSDPFYPRGIAGALVLEGSFYPALSRRQLVPLLADAAATQVDATATFSGGGLPTAFRAPLAITSRGVTAGTIAQFPPPGGLVPPLAVPAALKVKTITSAGLFSGEFTHPVSGAKTKFYGALRAASGLTPGEGRGNFRGIDRSGRVRITVP